MMSKVAVLALCAMVAISAAIPAVPTPVVGGVNPWIPPWIAAAPWMPQWTSCTTIGSTCLDCNTKLVCTKVGGLQRACTDPTLPYCNAGACSATPTADCAPAEAVPAGAAPVIV